jgi:hypothetical protein
MWITCSVGNVGTADLPWCDCGDGRIGGDRPGNSQLSHVPVVAVADATLIGGIVGICNCVIVGGRVANTVGIVGIAVPH